MKSRLWLCAKICIAASLLWYLHKNGSLTLESFTIFFKYPVTVLIVSVIFIVNMLVSSLRWKWLLSVLGVNLAYSALLDINIIGAVGSVILPGAVGGDAFRAYYVARKSPHMVPRSLLSLMADRLMGLLGLLVITAAAAMIYSTRFYSPDAQLFMQIIFGLLLFCAFAGICVISLANRFALRARLKHYAVHSKPIHFLVKLLDIFVIFAAKWPMLCTCLGLSVLMQLGTLWSLAILAQSMQIGQLAAFEYMTAGSFSMLANSIPLTPGGIGIGESAFNYFCRLFSENKEITGYASIFFSYRIIVSLLSLAGIGRFIAYRQEIK